MKSAFIVLDKPNDVKQLKLLVNELISVEITIEVAYQNMAYLH